MPPPCQAPGGRPSPAEPHGGHDPSLWTAAPSSPPFPRLGVLFSPLLPAMQIIKLLLFFYIKKVRCPLGPRRAARLWAPGRCGQPGWATRLADMEPRDLARVARGWQPGASRWGQSPGPRGPAGPLSCITAFGRLGIIPLGQLSFLGVRGPQAPSCGKCPWKCPGRGARW